MYVNILSLQKKKKINAYKDGMHGYDGEVEGGKKLFPIRAFWTNGWVLGYNGVSAKSSKNCSDIFGCQILFLSW